MKFLVLRLFLTLSFWGNLNAAIRTQVDLVNLTSHPQPGEKALIAMRFRCDPHFHIYWLNPGDAGQSATVEWSESSGASIGNFIWPGPKLLNQSGVMNFVYEGETLLLMEVNLPLNATDLLTLKGKVEWLECDDTGCWPQEKNVELKIHIGKANTAYKYDPKLYPALHPTLSALASTDGKSLTISLPSGSKLNNLWFPHRNFITATETTKQKHTGDKVVFSLVDATETLDSGQLLFTTQNPNGGFVNILAKLATEEVPTKKANYSKDGNSSNFEWQPWSPEAEAKALADGRIVYIDFTARWCATCQVNKRVYGQPDVAKALNNADVVMLKADWTKKNPMIADALTKYGRTGIPLNVFLKANQKPYLLSEVLTGSEVLDGLQAIKEGRINNNDNTSHSFAFWLFLAFGGGILLNLMPCVFPMIGLKVLSFAKEAGANQKSVILNGLLYSAGVILSFLALAGFIIAIKAGGNSVGWGFQMQSPGFVLATCVLMVVLGLSLAGVFEIGIGLSGLSVGQGNERVSTFFSGVLATVVATPCTAPGLGTALGFALDKERTTPETLLFFIVIGLGMALPYLLLSIFPQLSSKLPRPGEWMESLKQGMSFPLFGYALYLLWVLNALVEEANWVRDVSLGLAVIATACWVLGRWGALHRTNKERLIAKLSAAFLFLGTMCYLFATIP